MLHLISFMPIFVIAFIAEGSGTHDAIQVNFGLSPIAVLFVLVLVIVLVWFALTIQKGEHEAESSHGHDDHDRAGHDSHHADEHHAEVIEEESVSEHVEEEEAAVSDVSELAEESPAEEVVPEAVKAVEIAIVPDDLKLIEGIGPKISGLLKDAGIVTFGQLAETYVERLQEILDAAEIRIADPSTWPEQARLAAAADMAALQALQDSLKGGRAV